MIRLLLEDVTLLRANQIVAHVRFRGGATDTLRIPLPLSAAQLRKTDPAVIAEIDRLFDNHTEAEIAAILNQCGHRPGVAEKFSPRIVWLLRHEYGIEDRFTRLRRRGLRTLGEVSALLAADPDTVRLWARTGHIASHVYNDKGQRLYERPSALQQSCEWCGGPITAHPPWRRGRKWCSQRCCLAAYNRRKLVVRGGGSREQVA